MIVLCEASEQLPPSASARDIAASVEAARIAGCRVYTIPPDFEVCETAENALFHVPAQEAETPCFWIGYIPSPERYAALYEAAAAKNLRLPNTPDEHLTAQEFDRAYPRLSDLTPESVIVRSVEECGEAADRLGLPVFVKGAVQSRKAKGWKACVAETKEELAILAEQLFSLENRSRGRVVLRKLVRLRYARKAPGQDFPLGREYRAFIYRGKIVGLGYYWEGDDPLKTLTPDEEGQVRSLAQEAARRVGTPYIAVDVGQTEGGDWIVIETGDAQFSGVSQISLLSLWSDLRNAVVADKEPS